MTYHCYAYLDHAAFWLDCVLHKADADHAAEVEVTAAHPYADAEPQATDKPGTADVLPYLDDDAKNALYRQAEDNVPEPQAVESAASHAIDARRDADDDRDREAAGVHPIFADILRNIGMVYGGASRPTTTRERRDD
ncbi:hypothetical protein M0R72_13370 [Candidatus Pacearchaeota archaeon]|jgi:hypothetical protein|nr:hypothetical protein [Candidatus Pacearchaeota archaeon]